MVDTWIHVFLTSPVVMELGVRRFLWKTKNKKTKHEFFEDQKPQPFKEETLFIPFLPAGLLESSYIRQRRQAHVLRRGEKMEWVDDDTEALSKLWSISEFL